MKAKSRESRQGNFLYPDLLDQLNPAHSLLKLAKRIPWQRFEDEFAGLYSQAGRPAKPIRLMVGLLLLKQLESLSDERVVEAWVFRPFVVKSVSSGSFPAIPRTSSIFAKESAKMELA